MTKIENPDFTEKYRPKTIDEVILPEKTKNIFRGFMKDKYIPNLLLIGKPGSGKTSLSRSILDELDCDYIIINGSLEGNIETLRTKMLEFSSSVSFKGGHKVILLDEADFIPSQQVQPALRNFMETYSKNVSFILTVNYEKKLMPELKSRCTEIRFDIKKSERPKIALQYINRLQYILEQENIEFDKKILPDLVMKYFPDFRKVIHETQVYSKTGKIDEGILGSKVDSNIKSLIKLLKEKNYRDTTKWVVENYDLDPLDVMRKLYDGAYEIMTPNSVPSLVTLIADYQYKHNFVADTQINLLAFLANVMVEITWS